MCLFKQIGLVSYISDQEFPWPSLQGHFYKKKSVPLQARGAQDGGKVVSLMYRPLLPPENAPGTHFY